MRVLDDVVGNVAAVLTTLLVWPERQPPVSTLVAAAVAANQAYLIVVRRGHVEAIAKASRDDVVAWFARRDS